MVQFPMLLLHSASNGKAYLGTDLLSEVTGRMSDVAIAGPSIGVQMAQSFRRDDAPLSMRATLSHIRRHEGEMERISEWHATFCILAA